MNALSVIWDVTKLVTCGWRYKQNFLMLYANHTEDENGLDLLLDNINVSKTYFGCKSCNQIFKKGF